ncbi:hypothetical protein ACQ4PT_004549 [Festuca glaucescens]
MPPPLLDKLVEEVLLCLPPDEPALLVCSSAACKPWRRILASPHFRRRYREFHPTPPLLGFFEGDASFVPTTALLPSQPDRPSWISLDSRNGRVLLGPSNPSDDPFDLIVLDPMTGHQRRLLSPYNVDSSVHFSAAVLCAVQGCDHRDCQGGHFRVAFVSTDDVLDGLTSAWLCSSETGVWSELTIMGYPNGIITNCKIAAPSVLVGDALFFTVDTIIKYQLSTLRLSTFEKPITCEGPLPVCDGSLIMLEDGGLGFAAVVSTNLTMWSMENGPEGRWVKLREIHLKTLLSDGAFSIHTRFWPTVYVSGFAEGTQTIFVTTFVGCYMIDLKSGWARKVSCYYERLFPYLSFYIPGTIT